jgi:hypothetical protein
LGSVHVGLRVRLLDTIAAYGYLSVIVYVLALSSDSGFPEFGCLGVIFLFIGFHFVNKIFVSFKFRIYNILLHIVHTHGKLEVIYFSYTVVVVATSV